MTNLTPGWIGPRNPEEPNLDIGYVNGTVINCTEHNMGDCRRHTVLEVARMGNPPGLTDAEKLAALGTYLKVLGVTEQELRTAVTDDMGGRHVEKVGAYLPDGVKMASVSLNAGRRTAKVTDTAAALRWCARQYPDEIVRTVNPAFLKMLTDHAKAGAVGEPGVDPRTGELLDFIEVVQGSPYVTVTTTKEGVARMEALAHGFAEMLEADTDENGGPPRRVVPEDQYDPAFADRLENGAYGR